VLDLNTITVILRDYGLPLAILVAFAYLILTGRLRTESEVKQLVAQLKTDIDFRERLRIEERESRLKAEERVAAMTDVLREQAGLLQEISRDVLRGQAQGRGHDTH
jgi:hypothetical protein